MNTKRNADEIHQLMRSPAWPDDGAVKLYLYCLAMASHNQYWWRGLQLQPGDMPLSERKTAKALFWSRDKLRRRMRMLEAQGLVTIQSIPNTGTMLHVVNWPDVAAPSWKMDQSGSTMEPAQKHGIFRIVPVPHGIPGRHGIRMIPATKKPVSP